MSPSSESESQEAGAESVKRQQTGEAPPKEANPESLVGPTGGSEGHEPPKGTGESINRHGEDVVKREGKEAGRQEDEETTAAGRPSGSSEGRDASGVGHQEDRS